MYAPVQFPTDGRTWWAMIDTGAQVSIISAGIVEYLGLLDSEGVKCYPSSFTVSGFDGSSKLKMPIMEVWMRMGTKGGDERWEKIQLAVLDTQRYKLILGRDFIKPR